MQFPESWLREFCNPPLSTEQLAETLTMAGLEVEELKTVAPPFTNIVVGEIKEAVQHPNADRLRVCKVDVGQAALLDIVCGAPNARVGIKVPCAMVGAELPPGDDGKPFLIKVGKLRGVESQGMLCSARELKLSEDHGGLLELAGDASACAPDRTDPDPIGRCHHRPDRPPEGLAETERAKNLRIPWQVFTSMSRVHIIRPLSRCRGYSSAGRALAWHARGQRFDPAYLHQANVKEIQFCPGPHRLEA